MSDFITQCLNGECLLEDIDDFIDRWHDSDSTLALHEFLGMTEQEYGAWLIQPDILPQILLARRTHTDLVAAITKRQTKDLAAPASAGPQAGPRKKLVP